MEGGEKGNGEEGLKGKGHGCNKREGGRGGDGRGEGSGRGEGRRRRGVSGLLLTLSKSKRRRLRTYLGFVVGRKARVWREKSLSHDAMIGVVRGYSLIV